MKKTTTKKQWHPAMSKFALTAISLLLSLCIPEKASAQIDIDFNLARTSYIAHEPVTGEIAIVNRAGRDLVLSNDKGNSWLDFRITDGAGRLVTPSANAKFPGPVILNAGETYKRKIVVNSMYPMGKSGMYRIKPTVRLSQINRIFSVPRNITLTVVEGQKMWSQIFGVPPGREGSGTFREYSILTQHLGNQRKSLYFRLAEVKSGLIRKTYSLGDYMAVRPPKYVVDKNNQLHVFHMMGPKSYGYTIIDVDGKALDQQVYVVKGSDVPEMVKNQAGEIAVVGGMTLEESQESYENREFRNISERPPGLPRL